MSEILCLESVTAGYSPDLDIISDIDLSVDGQGITGLIGLNGAGKSTITKVIIGLIHPRKGRVIFDGRDITNLAPHMMVDLGLWLIPQESSLFSYMSVEENLRLPLEQLRRKSGLIGRGEISARIDEALTTFPILRTKLRSQLSSLSGGQQKMVELAKAQVIRPRLCLIDEPTVGLAPKIAAEVYEYIETFSNGGTAIFMIDHNIKKMVELSNKLYVLTLGRIATQGAGSSFSEHLHDHVKEWLGINL